MRRNGLWQMATRVLLLLSVLLSAIKVTRAQQLGDAVLRYEMGATTLREVWVDAQNGSDARSGATRVQSLRTLNAAWNRVPADADLTTGYRINLVRGTYPERNLPNYMENRRGTQRFPIIIRAVDGRGRRLCKAISTFSIALICICSISISCRFPLAIRCISSKVIIS